MNTIPNQSPNFMMKIAMSNKLDPIERNTAKLVSDYVKNTRESCYINDNVVLCFLNSLPKNQVLNAVFFDKKSGTFYRDTKGDIVTIKAKSLSEPSMDKCKSYVDRVTKKLSGIIHKEYKAPDWSTNPGKYADEERNLYTKQQIM